MSDTLRTDCLECGAPAGTHNQTCPHHVVTLQRELAACRTSKQLSEQETLMEANSPRPEFGGRTPQQQARNEDACEVIAAAIALLMLGSACVYLSVMAFGWWAR